MGNIIDDKLLQPMLMTQEEYEKYLELDNWDVDWERSLSEYTRASVLRGMRESNREGREGKGSLNV